MISAWFRKLLTRVFDLVPGHDLRAAKRDIEHWKDKYRLSHNAGCYWATYARKNGQYLRAGESEPSQYVETGYTIERID